jgi:Mn2+/Fe2+ NRAMP family transporter
VVLNRTAGAEAHGPAVLDEAHIGDIRGALGTIRSGDAAPRRGLRARLLTLLAVMGPGLIVMVGDNDAGGVATYSQAGQNYGTSLLWTLLLLIPVLIVNQEMVVRLGAVTGVGHARLINERFGRFWGLFSVGDLFILNFLTIVTEFIGIGLAASYFGISRYVAVPLAALTLIAVTASGNFQRWERFMFVFLAGNLLVLPLAFLSHPSLGQVVHDSLVPGIRGGPSSDAILLVIAIVGTTVAPWQLFFQQSNIVDKRITPRWIGYERADTVIGAVVVVIGAGALVMASAHAFAGTPDAGHFSDAGETASGLARYVGRGVGAIFALILLDASIIGACAVTLATSYAFGDVFGLRHSLHRSLRDAKVFYGSYTAMIALAAASSSSPTPRSAS